MGTDLVNARLARVSGRVDHVDSAGLEARQNEPRARLGRVRVAARARVPPAVMQLVADVRHLQTMNHLPDESNVPGQLSLQCFDAVGWAAGRASGL